MSVVFWAQRPQPAKQNPRIPDDPPLPAWAQRCIAVPVEVRQEGLWRGEFDPKILPPDDPRACASPSSVRPRPVREDAARPAGPIGVLGFGLIDASSGVLPGFGAGWGADPTKGWRPSWNPKSKTILGSPAGAQIEPLRIRDDAAAARGLEIFRSTGTHRFL